VAKHNGKGHGKWKVPAEQHKTPSHERKKDMARNERKPGRSRKELKLDKKLMKAEEKARKGRTRDNQIFMGTRRAKLFGQGYYDEED